jgi:predicted nicotinamide N-methyase
MPVTWITWSLCAGQAVASQEVADVSSVGALAAVAAVAAVADSAISTSLGRISSMTVRAP